ncbi:MAG: hypothetical protein AB7F98_11705 [Novosphingobium sp.]
MTELFAISRRPGAAIAMLAIPALMLSACGPTRDEALAAKVAQAENAAQKAEAAAERADRAARAAGARLNEINAANEDQAPPARVGDASGDEPIDTANAGAAHNTNLASVLGSPSN